MNKAYFTDLADYNRWADQKVMGWLTAISDEQWRKINPSSFSSVSQTALHIASAEKVWIDFWTGTSHPVYLSANFKGEKEALIVIWQEASDRLFHFIGNYPEDQLDHPVTFIYPDGRKGQMQFYQSFAHIVNHSTFHRGQLVTLLRQVGYEAFSSLDLATYYIVNQR